MFIVWSYELTAGEQIKLYLLKIAECGRARPGWVEEGPAIFILGVPPKVAMTLGLPPQRQDIFCKPCQDEHILYSLME